MKATVLFFALTFALSAAAGPAASAPTADQSCRAAKLKAAGKYAAALLGCRSKAASDGSAVDAECLSKAADKLGSSFDAADLKSGSSCDGLETTTLADVVAMADAVVAAAPALAGGGKCPAGIYKAAGKLASAELGAWSKFVTSDDATKRDESLLKARTKLGSSVTKSEGQEGCSGSGQGAAVQSATEDGIAPILACIAGNGLCVEAAEDAEAGEVVTTDDGGGADEDVPLTAAVETPNAGTVILRIVDSELPPPSGYAVLGQEVEVTAPDATAMNPLVLTFVIDASLLPMDPFVVTLTRNGVVLPDCSGAPDVASPDPCVQSRLLIAGGDLKIVALSSHASEWAPVIPVTPPTTVTTTTVTTTTTLPAVSNAWMRWQMRADKIGTDTASEIDIGWRGATHDFDPVDGSAMRFGLDCPSASMGSFGDCTVTGFDPAENNCRCSNATSTICDEPYASDADDCGGSTCVCFTRPPFANVASGTPVCMTGQAAEDASGDWNPDTGAGDVTLNENIRLYMGISVEQPCPVCVGDPTPNDGARGGTCSEGQTPGAACDANGSDPTFPYPGGGSTSFDCLPSNASNISGIGMKFPHVETTGSVSLASSMPCVGNTGENCPCAACSSDSSYGCSSNADCEAVLPKSCSLRPILSCAMNSDCANVNVGTCHPAQFCTGSPSVSCTSNSDCENANVGPCVEPTCDSLGGTGVAPGPNNCNGSCEAGVDGEAACSIDGPFFSYCDGLLEEDGKGVIACSDNTDCSNFGSYGNCTVATTPECFLPTISATGTADPDSPRTVAALCVGPISSGAGNSVSGLPGPARMRSDWTVTYGQ